MVEVGEILEVEVSILNWLVVGFVFLVNEEIMDFYKGKVFVKFLGDFGLSICVEII